MAGGKETPRQKLIGLMYLVLLALLALQVSASIMEKFLFLEDALKTSREGTVGRNKVMLSSYAKSVAAEGNKPKEVAALASANKVSALTEKILAEIDATKKQLIEKTGGMEEDGKMYKGAKEEDLVMQIMIGAEGSKSGEGYKLQKSLDEYYATLVDLLKKAGKGDIAAKLSPLALDGKDDPIFKNIPEQAGKDFAEINYGHTPMIAAMAVLEEKAAKIAGYESLILNELTKNVKLEFKPDKVVGMYSAFSSVVPNGKKYEAEMFLVALDTKHLPEMKFNGRALKVDADAKGKIEESVKVPNNPSSFDKDGFKEVKWKGEIIYKKPDNTEGKVPVEGAYKVSLLNLSIGVDAVRLFLGCQNKVAVLCPALGADYKPSFTATNASVAKGAKKEEALLVPQKEGDVTISVSSDGLALGSLTLPVKKISNPRLKAFIGTVEADLRNGIKQSTPMINVKSIPDPAFEEQLPKEANYKIQGLDAKIVRGSRVICNNIPVNNGVVNLRTCSPMEGDVLVLESKKVVRVNSLGTELDVPLSLSESLIRIPFAK